MEKDLKKEIKELKKTIKALKEDNARLREEYNSEYRKNCSSNEIAKSLSEEVKWYKTRIFEMQDEERLAYMDIIMSMITKQDARLERKKQYISEREIRRNVI